MLYKEQCHNVHFEHTESFMATVHLWPHSPQFSGSEFSKREKSYTPKAFTLSRMFWGKVWNTILLFLTDIFPF